MLTNDEVKQFQQLIREEVEPIKKDLKNVKSSIRKLNKDVNVMLDRFDRKDIKVEKRLDKIEEHLRI